VKLVLYYLAVFLFYGTLFTLGQLTVHSFQWYLMLLYLGLFALYVSVDLRGRRRLARKRRQP